MLSAGIAEYITQLLKRDTGLSFGTFQAGCIGLYWAGYVGVKVLNERHRSLFKHQRVGLHLRCCSLDMKC